MSGVANTTLRREKQKRKDRRDRRDCSAHTADCCAVATVVTTATLQLRNIRRGVFRGHHLVFGSSQRAMPVSSKEALFVLLDISASMRERANSATSTLARSTAPVALSAAAVICLLPFVGPASLMIAASILAAPAAAASALAICDGLRTRLKKSQEAVWYEFLRNTQIAHLHQ